MFVANIVEARWIEVSNSRQFLEVIFSLDERRIVSPPLRKGVEVLVAIQLGEFGNINKDR